MKNTLRKILISFICVFLLTLLSSCSKETTVTLHVFGDEVLLIEESTKTEYELPKITNRSGYVFLGWYDNFECSGDPVTKVIVSEDMHIYAKWKFINDYSIIYVNTVNGTIQESEPQKYFFGYDYQYLLEQPFTYKSRKIVGYAFTPDGEAKVTDTITDDQVSHYCDSEGVVKLYVVWGGPYEITYMSDSDVYLNKFQMRTAFYTDFYEFILTKEGGKEHLEANGIYNASDFVNYATDWNAGGKSDLYGIGNLAAQYYLNLEVGGSLENQPTTHFIGYCYQNNKWVDLIEFLIVFFAYWRTDEGYTGGPSDPDNTGNDFFASPWASLVDTAKMFYFTSDTLTDKYPWFTEHRSPRVHEALDNVPGCLNINNLPNTIDKEDITLPELNVEGKKFFGWFDNPEGIGNAITVIKAEKVNCELTIYAVWE